MNCFYHPSTVAVGICKSCGKGLCPACAVDLGKGLACKGRCESHVTPLIHMIDSSIALTDSKKANMRGGGMMGGYFYIALGLLFVFIAVVIHDPISLVFALPFGLILFTMGVLTVRRMGKLPK